MRATMLVLVAVLALSVTGIAEVPAAVALSATSERLDSMAAASNVGVLCGLTGLCSING